MQSSSSGSEEATDELIGVELDGRYRIDGVVGRGGMGAVYRGTQLAVDRSVAVKLIDRDAQLADSVESRFFREARVMSGLSHPNIVQLYDFGESDGRLYLVMELVDGTSLADLLDRRYRIDPRLAIEIIFQTMAGLIEAHAAGVIHRDMKPGNIMLSVGADGRLRVRILDFGIAYPRQNLDVRITQAGRLCGTPAYMAPEQARGLEVEASADIYSAGVMLFEMLAGQLPFTGNPMTMLFRHIQEPPPSLDHYVRSGDLPAEAVALLLAMLDKRPDERPSAADLLHRFEAMVSERLRFPIGDAAPFKEYLRDAIDPRRSTAEERRSNPDVVPVETTTPFVDADERVKGAWAAFMSASNDTLERHSPAGLDKHADGADYAPGLSFSPDEPGSSGSLLAQTTDDLAERTEFVVPEEVARLQTGDYDAVPGRAYPAPGPGAPPTVMRRQAPAVSTSPAVELDRPQAPQALPPEVPEEERSFPAWIFLLAFLVGVGLVTVFIVASQKDGFAPEEDTLAKEELDAYWLGRQGAGAVGVKAVVVADEVTSAPKVKKPSQKSSSPPKKPEVIDIWDDQNDAPTRELKIERKR